MPVASPIAPKSVLRHRPIGQVAPTRQTPRVKRARRSGQTQEAVPPFVRVTSQQTTGHSHWLTWLGVGMLLALAAVLFGQLVVGWATITWDDWHYGRPRTFQIDAVVGHGDSPAHPSHFLALNFHRRIEIIELPGGDPSHTKIYTGPQFYGPGADLVPVTLQFPDPNHRYHPDMIVLFQGTQMAFHNVDGSFQPG